MGRSVDQRFYNDPKWKRERKLYRQRHPFCERCLAFGIYKPTEIVHHREHLNESNVKDSKVSLNFENLEALCFDCHNKEHHKGAKRQSKRRFFFDEQGLVIKNDGVNAEDSRSSRTGAEL